MRSERKKESDRHYKKLYRMKLREKVFNVLGGCKCQRCGFNDMRALQLDHIMGGGKRDRLTISQISIYHKALKNPKDFQVLCANCNWIKRDEQNEVLKYRDSGIKFAVKPRVKVQQVKNGVVIATYESLVEAFRKTGIAFTSISQVIRGGTKRKTAGGFDWRTVPEPKEVIDYPLTLKL